jgi:hypothetical protein
MISGRSNRLSCLWLAVRHFLAAGIASPSDKCSHHLSHELGVAITRNAVFCRERHIITGASRRSMFPRIDSIVERQRSSNSITMYETRLLKSKSIHENLHFRQISQIIYEGIFNPLPDRETFLSVISFRIDA